MQYRASKLVITSLSILPPSALLLASSSVQAATPTYYSDLMEFQTDVTFTVTDDYMNPGYMFIQNDATMSAILGETDYHTTGFMNLNIVSGGYYCAGCNGSFELSFQTTTVGNAMGVNGVGAYIATHDITMPYYAFITFADGTQEDVQLPPSGTFWGVSAPERIERIHFGLSMGGATMAGSFGIDDLIVGDGFDMTPCGDGIVHEDEECDDMGESAACDANCTFALCGDNTLNLVAGEACDDGAPTATCNADCSLVACGDGLVNGPAGEDCDDMGESATCDEDCTDVLCGDGQLNELAGEICDDSAESPACDPDCTPAVCGDGYENNTAGEYCDDGNTDDGDGCSATCTFEEQSSSSEEGSSTGGEPTSEGGTTEGGETTDATGETTAATGVDTSGGESESEGGSGGMTGNASNSTSDPGTTEGGAESSTGEVSGATGGNGDGGGCGCTTDDRGGTPWWALALLALPRRRRR